MKNFFLKQATKHKTMDKVKKHVEYLIDDQRASHTGTNIKALNDDVSATYLNMNREFESYSKNKNENGGGRKANASTTYILSLPEDLSHPSDEQWALIYDQTINNFCEEINKNQQRKEEIGFTGSNEKNRKSIEQYNAIRLDPDTFKNSSVAVIHNEENNQEKASHVHIITSNIQDGQYLKMLNQTAGQNFIKKAYDQAVKNVLGLDPLEYVPKCDRLSKPEQDKLDLADKEQFENRDPENKGKRRRRRKPSKPAHIAREEQHQAKIDLQAKENDKFNLEKESFKTGKNKKITQMKEKVKEINTANKKVKKEEIKLLDEKSDLAFDKKEMEHKEELLDKKISAFERVMEKFNKWISSFTKDDIKAEIHAKETAKAIIELEDTQPKQAKKVSVMAQSEESRKSLLSELKEETKVSHHLKNRPSPFKNPNSMRP